MAGLVQELGWEGLSRGQMRDRAGVDRGWLVSGAGMTQETYDEICEYFTLADDTKEGDDRALTFRGFYEL